MVLSLHEVEQLVLGILNPNEELLGLYHAQSTNSVYVCVLSDLYYYKIFRISDHEANWTYRQDTFYWDVSDFTLRGKIRTYLYQDHNWFHLSRQTYAVMRFLSEVYDHNAYVYRSKKDERGKRNIIVFIQYASYREKYILVNQLVEPFERLIASGLFNLHHHAHIYPTQFVYDYLKRLGRDHALRPKKHQQFISWATIDQFWTGPHEREPLPDSQALLAQQADEAEAGLDQLDEVPVAFPEQAETPPPDQEQVIEKNKWWTVFSSRLGTWLRRLFSRDAVEVVEPVHSRESEAEELDTSTKAEVAAPALSEKVEATAPALFAADEVNLVEDLPPAPALVPEPKKQVATCQEPVLGAKVKQADPIKDSWEKNLAHRNKTRLTGLMDKNDMASLLAFKEDLPED